MKMHNGLRYPGGLLFTFVFSKVLIWILYQKLATLGGKMKGRSVQYHSNISKDEGRIFYDKFTALCEDAVLANSESSSDSPPKRVRHGTYGNRQVLSVETNGPFTHVFDF